MTNYVDIYERINQMIKASSNVLIMGHKHLDLDALGSALGLVALANYNGKTAHIILDDDEYESGVKKALAKIDSNLIVNGSLANLMCDEQTLLMIVDVHKPTLFQVGSLYNQIKNTIIIDHHVVGETLNATISYIDEAASSTCAMITLMLDYFNIQSDSIVSSIMLAGITIDTSNFNIKTDSNTYLAASLLKSWGADHKEVKYLLKQSIREYLEISLLLEKIEKINDIYAIVEASNRIYKREELARLADILLDFDNIEASFVIGKIDDNMIAISARSFGNVNVEKIMGYFDGGGHESDAACQIEGENINDIKVKLISLLKEA